VVVAELRALRRKYVEIVRLREQALRDPTLDPRREMAALALEFPGALREADEIPMDELLRRVDALAATEAGTGAVAPWMHAIARFHALTRGALCAKRWLRGRKAVDATLLPTFDREVHALCYGVDAAAWREALPELANPPRGRVTELVFERLGVELGVGAPEARALVFTYRRGRD